MEKCHKIIRTVTELFTDERNSLDRDRDRAFRRAVAYLSILTEKKLENGEGEYR